jgi:hypothetical protein
MVEEPDEHDLIFVGANDLPQYHRMAMDQATTNDIAKLREPGDKWVIQKVSGYWEVYLLSTLKMQFGTYTIGIPKITVEDFDAALAWAFLNL